MRLKRSLVAIAAVFLAGVMLPKSAAADQWNKRTSVTFSQDVEVSGTVLPAGTYVFQLADSQDRHIVQVFDQHGGILATVLTIPAARPRSTDDTRSLSVRIVRSRRPPTERLSQARVGFGRQQHPEYIGRPSSLYR
jgi:hypothetical protein